MKARPRHAENRIAQEFNRMLIPLGYDPVERIPVLGRTGPDLTINQSGLVIDVKSRQQCPKSYFNETILLMSLTTAAVCVGDLPIINSILAEPLRPSVMVNRWLDHMDEWRKENHPDGISMIILHKPGLPYGKSMAVFYLSDIGRLKQIFSRKDLQ
jgi:hypothetical protein